jgi:hypothetical protein
MERDHFKDLGVDGKIILTWIFKMDWIAFAQDRDRWLAFVNTVMSPRVP